MTTCFVYSGQSTLDPATEPAVIAFNADGSIKTTLATIAQVGSTNGLAIHSFSGDHFAAAFQKRHSDVSDRRATAQFIGLMRTPEQSVRSFGWTIFSGPIQPGHSATIRPTGSRMLPHFPPSARFHSVTISTSAKTASFSTRSTSRLANWLKSRLAAAEQTRPSIILVGDTQNNSHGADSWQRRGAADRRRHSDHRQSGARSRR